STGTANQLLADGTYVYAYDNEGSIVTRTAVASNATTTYAYDYRNRLVSVVDKDSSSTVTHATTCDYDALDRRTESAADGSETRVLLNQQDAWADADGAGDITARYLLGSRVDEMLARRRITEGTVWYLGDNLGTVRDLSDMGGSLIDHITYDGFGQP